MAGRWATRPSHPGAPLGHGALLALLLAVLAWTAPAQAQPNAAPKATARNDAARTELQWLRMIQSAAQRLTYSGTVIYQQGEEVRASRLIHVFDGRMPQERLQPLDGRPREYVRHGDEVQCLMPEARRIVVERRLSHDAFPAIASADPAEILQNYAVKLGDVERVAGLECQVIQIEPKDRLRFGYRLCVDRSNALLLRAVTLNERGEALEQMAFAEVRTGDSVDRGQLKPSWSTEGWRVDRTDEPAIDLARLGWTIVLPAGFRKLHEIQRSLWGGSAERKVMQAVLTDGLANVSVFIEPAPQGSVVEAAQSNGPTNVYARKVGDARVTVVGEVPMATVKAVAQSVEFRAPR